MGRCLSCKARPRGRETKFPRASIAPIHMAFNKTLLFEPIDERAGACPIQGHAFGECVLVDAGCIMKMNQNGKLRAG